jgi:hypothetical protein
MDMKFNEKHGLSMMEMKKTEVMLEYCVMQVLTLKYSAMKRSVIPSLG